MKRITAVLCVAVMLFSLTACSKTEDYSNQNITGQVTAIDGNKITLQLGELKEQDMSQTMENNPDEEQQVEGQEAGQAPPDIPEGGQQPEGQEQAPPDKPEGEQKPEDQGQTPPDIPEGEQQPEGQEPGQTPPDNGNGMPAGRDMKVNSFTAGDESVTLDFEGAAIKVEEGTETIDGTIEDISVDSILVVEVGDKNTVKAVTVKYIGGMGIPDDVDGSGD